MRGGPWSGAGPGTPTCIEVQPALVSPVALSRPQGGGPGVGSGPGVSGFLKDTWVLHPAQVLVPGRCLLGGPSRHECGCHSWGLGRSGSPVGTWLCESALRPSMRKPS